MKTFLILCFILCIPVKSWGQITDSLERQLKKENSTTERATLYFKIANEYSKSDSIKVWKAYQEGKKLISDKNAYLKSYEQLVLGRLYFESSYEKAQSHFEKGLEFIKDDNSTEAKVLRAKHWYNFGAIEQRKDNSDGFLNILLYKCLPLLKEENNATELAQIYLAISLVFYNENYIEKALEYQKKANELLIHEPKSPENNSMLLKVQIASAETCLKSGQLDQAKNFIDKASVYVSERSSSENKAEFYHINTIYYHLIDDNEKALEHSNLGLKAIESNKGYTFTRISFMKSWILSKMKRYDEAKQVLTTLTQNEQVIKIKTNLAAAYRELAKIEEETGNYKSSLDYMWKRSEVLDEYHAENQKRIISEMEAKYNDVQKEKELAVKELEINKKNQYMWMFIITTIVFFGAGLFTYFYYRNKKKLSEQREINLQQQLKEREQTEELKVTKAILDGEERERERVAKDLHDGLGGMLAGVKINLSTWSNNHLEENQSDSFHKIINQLDSSVSELRRIARNLMPESLLNFGLEIALKDLCEFYMKNGLTIDFQPTNIQKNLPLNLQINIYRIVQELLNNAVKHSQADNILVQCSQNEKEFYIP